MKEPFDSLNKNYTLLAKAGNMIKDYEEKKSIIDEYKNFLENSKKNDREILIKSLEKDEESNIIMIYRDKFA